jgi:hypothetical protein
MREMIFGQRRTVRYFQITKGSTDNPDKVDSWSIMTNLTGDLPLTTGADYTLRTWIEYGFKQVKNELGWHDYRLTDYASIERWWELIFSAYALIAAHAEQFKQHQPPPTDDNGNDNSTETKPLHPLIALFGQHPAWAAGTNWKSALNNLRLLLQPHCCWAWLEDWLQVFQVPGIKRGLLRLMTAMDQFQILPILR